MVQFKRKANNRRAVPRSAWHEPHLDAVDGYGRSVSEVRHERDFPPASDVHGIQPSRNLELLPR